MLPQWIKWSFIWQRWEKQTQITVNLFITFLEKKNLGQGSKYLDCKPLLAFLSTAEVGDGKQIVVHNNTEVLVPVDGRKELIEALHSTHMATDTMLRATKGNFL